MIRRLTRRLVGTWLLLTVALALATWSQAPKGPCNMISRTSRTSLYLPAQAEAPTVGFTPCTDLPLPMWQKLLIMSWAVLLVAWVSALAGDLARILFAKLKS